MGKIGQKRKGREGKIEKRKKKGKKEKKGRKGKEGKEKCEGEAELDLPEPALWPPCLSPDPLIYSTDN